LKQRQCPELLAHLRPNRQEWLRLGLGRHREVETAAAAEAAVTAEMETVVGVVVENN